MKRVLSGLQPTGQLHLGNYVGAIQQFIELQQTHEMYVFVASYHALTVTRDAEVLRQNIQQVVIDYLAFGLDAELRTMHIYLQHDVPQVTELTWLLSCVCPKHLMDKATTFKDKVAKGMPASVGLYTYPILQAADILGVDPDVVPVGEDQRQNVEIARDLAQKFNYQYGEPAVDEADGEGVDEADGEGVDARIPIFKVPEMMVRADAGVLPGIDGEKMSKSYDNTIDPFMPEKKLRKRIMKIVTDSTPMEESKDPERDTVFQIYRALAGREDERTVALDKRYREGGMGYGDAKQALFELILDHLGPARKRREALMKDPGYVQEVLKDGATAAQELIGSVTQRARRAVGL